MRRWPLACLGLAACGAPPGLTLEVVVEDPAITSVELIVSRKCFDCPMLMAAPAIALRPTVIHRSSHEEAWFAKEVVDGKAGFLIQVDAAQDQHIPLLVAVGYNDQKQALATSSLDDVNVSASKPQYWQTYLEPIVPLDSLTTQRDGTERIAVWRHPDQTEPSCVMRETWSAGVPATTAISPPIDNDCDGRRPDCAAYVPSPTVGGTGTLMNAACVRSDAIATNEICTLGGPSCTDGGTPGTDCLALDATYCVPQDLCACQPADTLCIGSKIINGTNTSSAMAHVRCQLGVNQDGSPCVPTVQLDGSILLSTGVTCDAIRVLSGFFMTNTLGDTAPVSATASLRLENFRPACSIDLTWMGSQMGQMTYLNDWIQFDLSNGRQLLLPIRMEVDVGCAFEIKCEALPGTSTTETIGRCAR